MKESISMRDVSASLARCERNQGQSEQRGPGAAASLRDRNSRGIISLLLLTAVLFLAGCRGTAGDAARTAAVETHTFAENTDAEAADGAGEGTDSAGAVAEDIANANAAADANANAKADGGNPSAPSLQASSMELQYAENFSLAYREDGAAILTLGGKDRYLLVNTDSPAVESVETVENPENPEGLPVIRYPVERVYLASSSVADLFLQLDALDHVACTSTAEADWRIPAVQKALSEGQIAYVGKYNAPDYEQILVENCDLVVENTMIFHNPEAKEKLEQLGLPVMVEYSSYEPHPLGRVEWIKLYGLLTGKLPEAEEFFRQQVQVLEDITGAAAGNGTGENAAAGTKTVAFFHITSNGAAVVRKSADYVTQMIRLAGGETALTELPADDNALSTVTIQMESFYKQARDADVLIYNSTITGDLQTTQDLLDKSELLKDFKAVQEGNVWCTEQSMFQQSSATAGMIADIHRILTDPEAPDQLTYLHRIR